MFLRVAQEHSPLNVDTTFLNLTRANEGPSLPMKTRKAEKAGRASRSAVLSADPAVFSTYENSNMTAPLKPW
jgi:hypothetical protein